MSTKTAAVTLKANVQGFVSDMKRAKQEFALTGKAARDLASDLDHIGNRSIAAGVALGAGLTVIANVYRKYDAALSDFRAVTGATEEQVSLMGETAQRVGQMYGMSAHEAAAGATALAKAGVSTKDVLTGGLEGAIALSATGSLELADAAEIAAIAMHQFGMSGKDIPLVADMLSKGANDAVGDVRDLAWALRQSGLVAGQFNLDLDDTVGTLSLFAQQGLIGSDAGTSFKSMLLAIAGPSGVSKKKMEELGISFYNANGEFIGLAESADMLQTQLGHLSEEERNFALSTIFGQDAIRSANILINEGGDAIREWSDNVNDAGYASELAQGKLDNLNGDLMKLKVAAENAVLNGGSGLNEMLRGLTQGATGFMQVLQGMDPVLAGNILKMAGATTGILLLVGGLAKGVSAALTMREHLRSLNEWMVKVGKSSGKTGQIIGALGKTAGVLTGVGAALAILGPALMKMPDQVATRTDFNDVLGKHGKDKSMTRAEIDALFKKQWDSTGRYGPGMTDINNVGDAFNRVYNPTKMDRLDDFGYTAGFSNEKSSVNMVKNTFGQADQSIAGMMQSGNHKAASDSFRLFNEAAREQGIQLQQVTALFPEYRAAIEAAAAANGETSLSTERLNNLMTGQATITEATMSPTEIAAQKQGVMQEAIEETGVALGGVIVNMETFLELLFATGMATMSSRDATAAFHESIRGVDETVKTLIEDHGGLSAALNKNRTDFNLTTEAGALANAAFQKVAQDGMAMVEAKAREGVGQDQLQSALKQTYRATIEAAEGLGINSEAAVILTRKIMGIPDDVHIDTWMSSEAKRVAEETQGAVQKLDGMSARIQIITERITQYRSRGTPDGNKAAAHLESKIMGQGRLADGGPVLGRGRPREDNIPIMASAGEFMLSNKDVDAMGGVQGVEAFRRQLHGVGARALTAAASARMPALAATTAPVAGGDTNYYMPITVPEVGATGNDILRHVRGGLREAGRAN